MVQVDLLNSARRLGAMRFRVPSRLLPLLVPALLAASGCFFEPRDAEPPEAGVVVRYQEQISPDAAWDNLETSAEASHAPGWETAISANDFLYIPDTEAESQFPGVFATPWTREREVAFINALYNSDVTITARMRNIEFVVPPSSGSQSVWEDVIYDLTLTSGVDASAIRYRGRATITFTLEGNFWYITQWRDEGGENDPDTNQPLSTLGVLRGNFASK